MDVTDMLIKAEFIVEGESNVFEAAGLFSCTAMRGDGVQSSGGCIWCINDEFLCFVYIEFEVIVCAPLRVIGCDGVIVFQ